MAYDRDTIYRTSDGREFYNNQNKARKHQDYLDGITEEDLSLDSNILAYNRLLKLYQAEERDWNKIVSFYEDNKYSLEYNGAQTSNAKLIYNIARAIINDDYLLAFKTCSWGECTDDFHGNNPDDKFGYYKTALNVGKKIWEKQNGRAMTDADLAQLKNEYDRKNSSSSSYTPSSSSDDEDSSTSSVDDNQRNGFVSFLFGLVGAVGSVLGIKLFIIPRINLVDEWILVISICLYLIVPLVALGVTYSAWRNKRNILLIIMLALIIPGYIGFIGTKAMSGKTPKAKTETTQSVTITQQADIINNVNFRKDPSTGDNIIRQLKKGDTVTLTGETVEGWTQITHNGDTGWVSSEFLKVWGK